MLSILHCNAYLVVHLFRAVEHVHHNSQSSPQILSSLGFTGSRGTGRRTAHGQMKRLSQSNVTSDKGKKFSSSFRTKARSDKFDRNTLF